MGHAITFAQQKGGAGKTTLLAHLAHSFALKKQQVALLDLDPQGSLTQWASIADIENLTMLETASYRIGGDIRSAKDRYDFVLVDCPGNASSTLEAAIRESTMILIPCQPSMMDVWASSAVLAMCKKEDKPARVIFNRVPPRGTAADMCRTALKEKDAQVLKSNIGNRVTFSKSFGEGSTALTASGQKVAKEEISALAKEVSQTLKKLG